MWMRVKGLLLLMGTRLFLRMVRLGIWAFPVLFTVDSFILRNYERFIAAPLQTRGVNLRRQVQAIWILGAFYNLFNPPLSLRNLPGFVIWMANAFFMVPEYLAQEPTEDLCRNPNKVLIVFVFLRWAIYWIPVGGLLVIRYSVYPCVFGVLMSAIVLTMSCDPKPPRPKRVKSLVLATEGV